MFTAIFTTMVPQSVTQKGVAWTQAALVAPTYLRARVVDACWSVHHKIMVTSCNLYRRVDGASHPVANALVGALTPVHRGMERVHLDSMDHAYRVEYALKQKIMGLIEKSPTVNDLRKRVEELTVVTRENEIRAKYLTVVCLILVACNALLLFKLSFC